MKPANILQVISFNSNQTVFYKRSTVSKKAKKPKCNNLENVFEETANLMAWYQNVHAATKVTSSTRQKHTGGMHFSALKTSRRGQQNFLGNSKWALLTNQVHCYEKLCCNPMIDCDIRIRLWAIGNVANNIFFNITLDKLQNICWRESRSKERQCGK